MTCSVCGSERVFRRGRCDRDYRWWREHDGEDRVLTQEERSARTDRQNDRRRERENLRELILAPED